jgi:hypothetical protein
LRRPLSFLHEPRILLFRARKFGVRSSPWELCTRCVREISAAREHVHCLRVDENAAHWNVPGSVVPVFQLQDSVASIANMQTARVAFPVRSRRGDANRGTSIANIDRRAAIVGGHVASATRSGGSFNTRRSLE